MRDGSKPFRATTITAPLGGTRSATSLTRRWRFLIRHGTITCHLASGSFVFHPDQLPLRSPLNAFATLEISSPLAGGHRPLVAPSAAAILPLRRRFSNSWVRPDRQCP